MSLHCTWADAMREAALRLSAIGIENPHRDARLLLAHALGIEPVDVLARDSDAIDGAMLAVFEAAIQRRLAGEPVSRIRGWREFYGRRFSVTPDVLDPRPETELLVAFALKHLPHGGRVLDLGTGSGCILVSILAERSDATGVGLDLSSHALHIAAANAQVHGAASRASFVLGDWPFAETFAPFDLVVSNPPYIADSEAPRLARDVLAHDPHLALFGGADGLRDVRAIAALAPRLLKPGGAIAIEIGLGQAGAATTLLDDAGLVASAPLPDLAGIDRVVIARMPLR
jgi:release factor glutamine methyltransferase